MRPQVTENKVYGTKTMEQRLKYIGILDFHTSAIYLAGKYNIAVTIMRIGGSITIKHNCQSYRSSSETCVSDHGPRTSDSERGRFWQRRESAKNSISHNYRN